MTWAGQIYGRGLPRPAVDRAAAHLSGHLGSRSLSGTVSPGAEPRLEHRADAGVAAARRGDVCDRSRGNCCLASCVGVRSLRRDGLRFADASAARCDGGAVPVARARPATAGQSALLRSHLPFSSASARGASVGSIEAWPDALAAPPAALVAAGIGPHDHDLERNLAFAAGLADRRGGRIGEGGRDLQSRRRLRRLGFACPRRPSRWCAPCHGRGRPRRRQAECAFPDLVQQRAPAACTGGNRDGCDACGRSGGILARCRGAWRIARGSRLGCEQRLARRGE